jgi:cytochrome c biogenesis protein CcmG/thiol:disulfide interchange protein DsbE
LLRVRKLFPWLVDLASGLLFVAIAFFSARVLLQSRALVYLVFPLLCTAALLVGFWRRRIGAALLVSAPLFVVAIVLFSGRNRPFIVFPIVVLVFVAAGAMARARALVLLLVVTNAAAVFAGPLFVSSMLPNNHVHEAPIAYAIHLVDGRTITSEQLRGRVVVLDFWATWCVPCRYELPVVQSAYNKRKDAAAFFAIDGVMTDAPGDAGDTAERAAAFFRRGGYTIPLAWDGGAVLEKAFAPRGFPTLLVLDKTGAVRMRHTGFLGAEDLEATLLREIDALR